jgi:hypothetical protein
MELVRRLELDRFLETVLPSGCEEIGWASMALVFGTRTFVANS